MLLILLTIIISSNIGSFLNVIIFRYPLMLENQWQYECHQYLKNNAKPFKQSINLWKPSSHCFNCFTTIQWKHKIPLLSYCISKGSCPYCFKEISPTYVIVECLSVMISLLVIHQFGLSIKSIMVILFSFGLIVLSTIDIRKKILPDTIVFFLLWLGLLCNLFGLLTSIQSAIIGAVINYVSFWLIANLFKFFRKKEGLGYGDLKLFSMIGAWLGVDMSLPVVLIATLLALLTSAILLFFKKITTDYHLPFGAFLAISSWCVMMFL